jgi:hypothetical protein
MAHWLCDVCLAIQVPTCSPSSSCHPFSLPLERRASTLHTLHLFSISRTDIIKLATVNTYRSIKSVLFDHGINQIYAGAVTSRSMLKHNESIRPPTTSITSRYRRGRSLGSMFGSTCVMCRRASFALPSNRGRIDEHASTLQQTPTTTRPRAYRRVHHVLPASTLVYRPITVADTTTTLPCAVK